QVEDLTPALQKVFPHFLKGRFFVPAEEDELDHLRERTDFFKQNDPFLVTITTTMDCNFDCYYCYEDKDPEDYLSLERCDQLLEWIEEQIELKGHTKLYTDWYGGEPMMNRKAIDYLSEKAIALCEERGIGYSSAMISNGTFWPEDARDFVRRNRIRHVQFTLDGPPKHHNVRRGYKKGHEQEVSSFDTVAQTIDRVLGATRVYLRINVDPGVGESALELVDFFAQRGWLHKDAHIYPYLAAIGPMTEHCGFIGTSEKFQRFQTEFDVIKDEFQKRISEHIDPRGIEHLQIYPSTRRMNCAAVGENSVVFGPDGLMYKCGLDVGVSARAHDSLESASANGGNGSSGNGSSSPFVILNSQPELGEDAHPYSEYDPFTHERCSQCQYLPVCLGGCPKTHFEHNEYYLSRRSEYWEENFETLIQTYADSAHRHAP
ncbi:MAG: radical SAM protein, partial [bacterium]|nr:radical SAM protein [bacterium]